MFIELQDMRQFKEVLQRSRHTPIMLFFWKKNDGISNAAKSNLDSFKESHPEIDMYITLLETHTAIIHQIEDYFHIVHECPLLIGLRKGRAELVLSKEEIDIYTLERFHS